MRQLGRGTCAYYVTTNDVPEKEQCEIHLISFEAICSFPFRNSQVAHCSCEAAFFNSASRSFWMRAPTCLL